MKTIDSAQVKALSSRKHPLAQCEICPLKDKKYALTTGPKDAKIAVVSRSPGYHEVKKGESFSGPTGQVLDHLLHLQGIKRYDVLTTNVVLCETGDKPPQEAIDACKPRLLAEIADCDTIIAAGAEAVKTLTDATSVHSARGYAHTRRTANKTQRIIATTNPAVVLRDDGSYPDLVRDFRLAINPRPKPQLPSVRYTDDLEEARRWVAAIVESQPTFLASDIEARGRDGRSGLEHNAQVVCVGFASRGERAIVFGERVCTNEDFLLSGLRQLYELPNCRYLWHNGRYDVKVLRSNGINARVDEDTLLLSWVLDERPGQPEKGIGGHSLDYLLKDQLGWPKYESESVKQFKKDGIVRNAKELYTYNGLDTAGGFQLYDILMIAADADGVLDLYRTYLLDYNEALTRIELEGTHYDVVRAADMLEEEVWPALENYKYKMRVLIEDDKFNPNSHVQTAKILYDKWELKHDLMRKQEREKIRNGEEPRSVDTDVRKEILEGRARYNTSKVHETRILQFVQNLDDFKSLDKQRGTYLEGLILKIWPDGKIYNTYKIHGTETGRASSAAPNMQNITRTKPGLPNIRGLFHADPGCVLIQADYSQAELRVIAYLSDDVGLKAIYSDPTRSLHKEMASSFYGEDYNTEQYTRTKNINFGVAYRQSAFAFAQMYQMPQEEAQAFIDAWFERFPRVYEWGEEVIREMKERGELRSPFGHKRRFYLLTDQNKNHAEKEAINFKPQNIAANLTLWSVTQLTLHELDWKKAQIRITVHDSIILNAKESYADEAEKITLQVMEAAPKETIGWNFPFTAESGRGYYWSDAK